MSHTEYMREYTRRNREKINAWRRKRYAERRDEINRIRRDGWSRNAEERRRVQNEYWKKNPEKKRSCQAAYMRKRRRTDPSFKMLCRIRRAIAFALNGTNKKAPTLKLLGCSIESYRIYLSSLFETGMTWDNYGSKRGQWSIDHIVPVSLFDLTNEDHQKHCFHFSNTKPMWHVDNVAKGNRILPRTAA